MRLREINLIYVTWIEVVDLKCKLSLCLQTHILNHYNMMINYKSLSYLYADLIAPAGRDTNLTVNHPIEK